LVISLRELPLNNIKSVISRFFMQTIKYTPI
jgi:hypothetical protein